MYLSVTHDISLSHSSQFFSFPLHLSTFTFFFSLPFSLSGSLPLSVSLWFFFGYYFWSFYLFLLFLSFYPSLYFVTFNFCLLFFVSISFLLFPFCGSFIFRFFLSLCRFLLHCRSLSLSPSRSSISNLCSSSFRFPLSHSIKMLIE